MRFAIAARGALVLGCLAMAVSAPAQQDQEFRNRPIPGWSFTPRVAIGTLFDSNVGLSSGPSGADATGEGDRLFLIEPSAQLDFNGPRTTFRSGYRGHLRRYADLDALNGYDQRGQLTLRHRATKHFTVFASENYTKSPTTDELELNGVPFSRTGSRQNSIRGGIEAQVSRFTSIAAEYNVTSVDFDREDSLFSGGNVQGLRGNVRHQVAEHVSLGGEYSLRRASLEDGTRQLTFNDVGGTIHLQTGAHTSVDGAAGMSFLSDATFDTSRTGPYFRASIAQELEYALVGGSFERTFVPSFGFGGSTRSQDLRGYIRMPIDRRMYVQGSAGWRRTDPLIENELRLDTTRLQGTLGYSLARWLHVEGFYNFTRQETQVGGVIGRHRAGIQAVIAQPMRLR